jgi:hypothetical protein
MTPLFYLGAPAPGWLARAGVPLFVSDTRLRVYKRLPRAVAPWACDSGGFTQLKQHGRWTITPREYVDRLRRYRDDIGMLDWAAPQDMMCESIIINGGVANGQRYVGTRQFLDPDGRLTEQQIVRLHQRFTVLNVAQLRELAPDLNIITVVQGQHPEDYVYCKELYWQLAGIDLTREPVVGVGSVCRRQGMDEAGQILQALHDVGLTRLHGFGFKLTGLREHGHLTVSDDSMAWSFVARRLQRPALPECIGGPHKNCANCFRWAMHWRRFALIAASGRHHRPAAARRALRAVPTAA